MPEIKTISINELKPGMIVAKEIRDNNGNILLEAENPLSYSIIDFLRIRGISQVDILFLDKIEDLGPLENLDIKDEYTKIVNGILLFDVEVDEDLRVKRLIKRLSNLRNNEIIEACRYVLEFYEDKRAKELAVMALGNIKNDNVIKTLLIALKDLEESVRISAQKLIVNYFSDKLVEELIDFIKECRDEKIKNEVLSLFTKFNKEKLIPILNKFENKWKDDSIRKSIIGNIRLLFDDENTLL